MRGLLRKEAALLGGQGLSHGGKWAFWSGDVLENVW